MKRVLIIFIVVAIISAVTAYFFLMKKKENEILAKEKESFNGLSRSDFVLEMQKAWKKRWLEAQTKYILTASESADWRRLIEEQIAKAGNDPSSLPDEVALVALAGWAKDNPKAWATTWSKNWLSMYVSGTMGVETKLTEVQALMKTI